MRKETYSSRADPVSPTNTHEYLRKVKLRKKEAVDPDIIMCAA